MSFSDQLAAFAAKAKERQDQVLQGVVKEVGERLVERTPVESGAARAHWGASINTPIAEQTQQTDPSGAASIAEIDRVAERAKFGDIVFILNAAPHVKKLEDGYSDQAPVGMVAVTVAEGRQIVEDVARKVVEGRGGAK